MIIQEVKTKVVATKSASASIYAQVLTQTDFTDELIKVRNTFKKESDRALIILACSAIDEILKRIVAKKMILVSNKKELLLNTMQPLSSFSAKIELCFRLGIISETLKDDLNIVRKMRNKYAHDLNDVSLEDQEMSVNINKILEKCPKIEHNSKNGNQNPTNRIRIEGFIGAVLVTLNSIVLKLEQVKPAKQESFIYDIIN